jgi:hypothetical protein
VISFLWSCFPNADTLWCNTWNLLNSCRLFETQYTCRYVMHVAWNLHPTRGHSYYGYEKWLPQFCMFCWPFVFVELKQTCESPNNWRCCIDSLLIGSIMCISVNRSKGPSKNTETNTHTYREVNNLKWLPVILAFFNMMAPACYMWTELQLRHSSVITRILGQSPLMSLWVYVFVYVAFYISMWIWTIYWKWLQPVLINMIATLGMFVAALPDTAVQK